MDRMTRRRERIRRLLDVASPLSETYPENRASLNLHLLGLHDFAQQAKIDDRGRLLTIVDFLCAEAAVVLYVDGAQKYVDHGADIVKKEMLRHNRLLANGCTVVRFGFAEVLSLATFSPKLLRAGSAAPGAVRREAAAVIRERARHAHASAHVHASAVHGAWWAHRCSRLAARGAHRCSRLAMAPGRFTSISP